MSSPPPDRAALREPIRPDPTFLAEVEAFSGEPVSRCFQCAKCSHGCPLGYAMDVLPNQAMRMVQHGLSDELFGSRSIWLCAACQTCTTRCPNDIDIAHLMDSLRQLGRRAGRPPAEPAIAAFHEAFLASVRRHGRVFELGAVARARLAAGRPFADVGLGWQLLKRGKLRIRPQRIADRGALRAIFARRGRG